MLLCLLTMALPAISQDVFESVELVAQSIPSTMEVGKAYPVEISIKNGGSAVWSNKAGYVVRIQQPGDEQSWGQQEVRFSKNEEVAPGETKTFRFNVTAPYKPNTYQFNWRLVKNNMPVSNEMIPPSPVVVVDPSTSAIFVSQLVPDRITEGETFKAIIQFKNVSRTNWSRDAGYRLVPFSAEETSVWRINSVSLEASRDIPPGEIATFSFNVMAPKQPGIYSFRWQMARGDDRFGMATPTTKIMVTSSSTFGPETYGAEFISQNVPEEMKTDRNYTVIIVFKNTGNRAWRAPRIALGSQNPENNLTWLLNRVEMKKSDLIKPGQVKAFEFDVRAPLQTGDYNFQWQLINRSASWFGDKTENITVRVKPDK
jgi:hypothetical protein